MAIPYPFGMQRVTDSFYVPLGATLYINQTSDAGTNTLYCDFIDRGTVTTIVNNWIENGGERLTIVSVSPTRPYTIQLSGPLIDPVQAGALVNTIDPAATRRDGIYPNGALRRITVSRYEPDHTEYSTPAVGGGGGGGGGGDGTLTNLGPTPFVGLHAQDNTLLFYGQNGEILGTNLFTVNPDIPCIQIKGENSQNSGTSTSELSNNALVIGGGNVFYGNPPTLVPVINSLSFNLAADDVKNKLTISGSNWANTNPSVTELTSNTLKIGRYNFNIIGDNVDGNLQFDPDNGLTLHGPNADNSSISFSTLTYASLGIGYNNNLLQTNYTTPQILMTDGILSFPPANANIYNGNTTTNGTYISRVQVISPLTVTNKVFFRNPNNNGYLILDASNITDQLILKLPTTSSTAGYLYNDGSGNLSWQTPT